MVPWRGRRRRVGLISSLSLPLLVVDLLVGGERLWAVVPGMAEAAAVSTMMRVLVLRLRRRSDAASSVDVEFVRSLVQEVAGSGCFSKRRTRRRQGVRFPNTRCEVCGRRSRRGSSVSAAASDGVGTGGVPGWFPAGKPQRRRLFGPLMRSSKAQMRDEATPALGAMDAPTLLRRCSDSEGDQRWAMEMCAEDPKGVCVFFICFGVFLRLCWDICPLCCFSGVFAFVPLLV